MHTFEALYPIGFTILVIVVMTEFILLQFYKYLLKRNEIVRDVLFETNKKISNTDDEDEIYTIVLNTIVELIPNARKGSVLLLNEDGEFQYRVVKGFQKELENFKIKKEEAYLYKINQFRETAIIHNPEEYDSKNTNKHTIDGLRKINALDISCSISAPIYIDHKLFGLINVDADKKNYKFTERDLELMNQIKCELELAIRNALAQNQLKYMTKYDELTGVMNKRALKTEFDHEVEAIKHSKKTCCLVMIDMDNFKMLNDTYGHFFGDSALKHFSGIICNSLHQTDLVARFAGDEFILLFKECELSCAEKKMLNIKQAIMLTKLEGITLNFSYGICEISPEDGIDFDKALAVADTKMYKQKKVKEMYEI